MNRRDWLKTAGAAGIAAGLPQACKTTNPESAPRGGTVSLETEIIRLNLRNTWTTTMSSSTYRDTLHVRYTRDGITGYGEGAPIVRYKEDAAGGQKALEGIRDLLTSADPWKFEKLMIEISRRIRGEFAAKSAFEIALMDWIGKSLNVPLYRYFGLDPKDTPVTTFSIGMDDPETTKQKIQAAEAFPVLKIKVGVGDDEKTIAAVRAATGKPIRVDANEGWTRKEEAVRKINWLASQGVEFVEQPMPAAMIEETKWVRKRVHLPIIADEACLNAAAIPQLAEAYDGINVKLDKAGGILQAYRMIQVARALGMKTMLGCMVSSSCTVTAAAHISPLVDYADLDGNLLISNDPYTGVQVDKGKLILPDRPGLGLLKAVP
jgi:L-Ala-D/L-Glu epimerase